MTWRRPGPEDPPAIGILVHYGSFFLLALPFLGMRARPVLLCAGTFALAGPLLLPWTGGLVPEHSSHNPAFSHLMTEPVAVFWQLLLTGTYPAATYLAYLLAGLTAGRLNLRSRRLRAPLLTVGLGVAVAAGTLSWMLLYWAGGYHVLLFSIESLTRSRLDHILVFGPARPALLRAPLRQPDAVVRDRSSRVGARGPRLAARLRTRPLERVVAGGARVAERAVTARERGPHRPHHPLP